MKFRIGRVMVGLLMILSLAQLTLGQAPAQTASALPHLVRFGGTVKDLNGSPLTGVVGITFALYSEQIGGSALWLETQNVTADSTGHYTVLLGSTTGQGLPESIFTSEQAHWVGVQVQGQAEQPRVLLVSAPYALKAGDAETIGGLPPSAFMLAPASANAPGGSGNAAPGATGGPFIFGSGTANFIPLWTSTSLLADSVLFQSGSGNTAMVGINTTTPAATLDVNGSVISRGSLQLPSTGTATAGSGFNSQPFDAVTSVFNSTGSTAQNQDFRWLAEPVGNNTSSPSGKLDLLFGANGSTPAETGLSVANNGIITFAAGQTFGGGGGGTVTSVGTGLGLKGGPITTSGTLIAGAYASFDFPGASSTEAFSVNSTGDIVGPYTDASNIAHGFLLSGGNYTAIDFPGSTASLAGGINDSGVIVGDYCTTTECAATDDWTEGYLLSGGVFTTFEIPGEPVTIAENINNKGVVVGFYQDAAGLEVSFLATPN
ncbi:MAG: hypothetical protein WBQ09_17390 [Terriglobales bacterium]